MSIISALRRQETLKFKATLEYLVRVYLKKEIKEPGMVSHTCNPSYSGGGDLEDCGLRSAQAVSESPSQPIKKLVMLVCTCHPQLCWKYK
jgi:hypothetical protein